MKPFEEGAQYLKQSIFKERQSLEMRLNTASDLLVSMEYSELVYPGEVRVQALPS